MPREVTLDATGPRFLDADDVDPAKGDVAVCQCGLSEEFPFCDGSHRSTEDEAPDERYKYVDGERRVVAAIELADGERLVPDSDDDETANRERADDETANRERADDETANRERADDDTADGAAGEVDGDDDTDTRTDDADEAATGE
jgi:CDGSH-type Zn-finger protein